jgi:hypothetical protein
MMARAVLLALLVSLIGLAVAVPSAAARPPVVQDCVVGSSEPDCLVSIQMVVCVTDPCDTMDVCLLYGFVCPI